MKKGMKKVKETTVKKMPMKRGKDSNKGGGYGKKKK